MNKKIILFSLFLFAGILFPHHSFSQKAKPFSVDVRDLAFRTVANLNSEWTDYKKKKMNDEYFKFLDSAEAMVTIRVEMKTYAYDDRKKITMLYTKPAEFNFEAEEEMKLRLTIEPFKLDGDTVLRKLEVKKDVPTYLDVTGKITKPKMFEVQATPREKRKDLHLTLTDVKVVQSKDNSENPYYWKKSGKIIPMLSELIEKRKLNDGFDLSGLGFRKIGQ